MPCRCPSKLSRVFADRGLQVTCPMCKAGALMHPIKNLRYPTDDQMRVFLVEGWTVDDDPADMTDDSPPPTPLVEETPGGFGNLRMIAGGKDPSTVADTSLVRILEDLLVQVQRGEVTAAAIVTRGPRPQMLVRAAACTVDGPLDLVSAMGLLALGQHSFVMIAPKTAPEA